MFVYSKIHFNSRFFLAIILLFAFSLFSFQVNAFPKGLNDWQDRYGATSTVGDTAQCQTCHVESNGGEPWNGYGWDIREALANTGCDFNNDGTVTNQEAFFCIEMDNSDNDGSLFDNATEIGLNTQPGWTNGATNTHYSRVGVTTGNLPPSNIGALDPDGTEPPPPPPPPPPADDVDVPTGQKKRKTIVVRPGQSIQAAIDKAKHGTRIYVLAGTYSEQGDPTNGLNITKSGISLIGQKTKNKEVVFENAGNQRNGIVVVPPEVTDCMSCHVSMAPPFGLHDWVEANDPEEMEPELYDIEIRGITIKGFDNNGLFTERVDGFKIVDVHSVDNRNYGIFPTLSKNGLITHSTSVGSDKDSGIWVETSENVDVLYSRVEGAVNGFEVSNSDDILLAHNVATNNTVGAAILLLPDIFDNRAGAKRIDMRNNHIYSNNKFNSARPGSILSTVPSGTGIFYLGVDDSIIANNLVEDNKYSGILMVDYCVATNGTSNACGADPDTLTPGFIDDQAAVGNRVVENTLINNGTNPDLFHPFAFAAADITEFTGQPGNCYEANEFNTYFALIQFLPPCN